MSPADGTTAESSAASAASALGRSLCSFGDLYVLPGSGQGADP